MSDERGSGSGIGLSRRSWLLATGGAVGAGGAALVGGRLPSRGIRGRDDRAVDHEFLWLNGAFWGNPAIRRNLLAFARRHDLLVVLSVPSPVGVDDALIEDVLPELRERDLSAWLATGVLKTVTAPEFIEDPEKRARHLEGLRSLVSAYDEYFPDGRVVCWQEAPIAGHWVEEGGVWNQEAVDNVLEHGPEIFAAQRRAIAAVDESIDVGIFVHFPYIVDSKRPDVFETLMADLAARRLLPDFCFVDFYRGYYEANVGPARANDAVRSLIDNAREHADVDHVAYMGQAHTINNDHTPSKQSMRMDLRASAEAGADAVGWYLRGSYRSTGTGFDPFVPNVDSDDLRDDPTANTYTAARDRIKYAFVHLLSRRETYGPDRRFDLWIAGHDTRFHEHELRLRTTDGSWEFVGDFGGYVTADYPYHGAGRDHVSVFHALDRDRYVDDGEVRVRIDTDRASDGATLRSLSAVPFDPGGYLTEREATKVLTNAEALDPYLLGCREANRRLEPGSTIETTLPIDPSDETRSLHELLTPEHVAMIERLTGHERSEDFDPRTAFDLWIVDDTVNGSIQDRSFRLRDRAGDERRVTDLAVAAAAATGVAAFYGVDRGPFFAGDDPDRLLSDVSLTADSEPTVAYAMPYFGSDNFRAPAEIRSLVETQPDEVATFALDLLSPP